MSDRTVLPGVVPEKSTLRITGRLQDENNVAIGVSALTTLTLTLFDKASASIVNSRSASDIKNANGGTVDANGNFTLVLGPLDGTIIDSGQPYERHVALFEWTYGGGSKQGRHEVEWIVRNLSKVS